MSIPFTGGCACKAVRYEVSAAPIAVMDCHCRACQYASGGASTTAVVVPRDAFRVTQGTAKRWASLGESGTEVYRFFCDNCGSPLFSEPPGGRIWVVKAATLDDPGWLKLGGALYTSSAQPWAHIDSKLPAFPKMPPRP
jgi:hypothetical protein